jgi:hypothetical protein
VAGAKPLSTGHPQNTVIVVSHRVTYILATGFLTMALLTLYTITMLGGRYLVLALWTARTVKYPDAQAVKEEAGQGKL